MTFWIVVAAVIMAAAALAWWLSGRSGPEQRLDRAARRQRADREADADYRGITPKGPTGGTFGG